MILTRVRKTSYNQDLDGISIGSNVFPDLINPTNISDKLSVACVLAHEYYEHRSMREEYLKEEIDSTNSAIDEFNASFRAYKNTPNLTEDERNSLFMHAFEIAKTNMLKKEIEICNKIIESFYETDEENEINQKIKNQSKMMCR